MLHFDSDYMEGALPQIVGRLVETNLEQTTGYGSDPYTERAKTLIRQACDNPEAEVHFLVGGTQTNATVIDALLARHEGVLAAETAHINVHESGAIEACGHKVLALPQADYTDARTAGKITADDVDRYITNYYRDETYEHMVCPGMVYISQPTEYGTLYSLAELQALHTVCTRHHIPLYIDGARLGYALSAPDADFTLLDIARTADIFYIGGTKCGALFGEAVVARPGLLKHFFPLVKQHGALLAKGRLLGLQFETLFGPAPLTDNETQYATDTPASASALTPLYIRACGRAVGLALRLKQAFAQCGYPAYIDSPTNQQFFDLPNELIDRLRQVATFETWGSPGDTHTVVRFVTSWATTPEAVDRLIEELN